MPRNPLDVLAQQIVAVCAQEEISVDELHELVQARVAVPRPLAPAAGERARHARRALSRPRSSRSCARASPGIGSPVLLRGREGARRLAVTNAGTIPDRGLFGVLPRRGRRPGRRARRGDGLRGARRPDVPPRRVDLADRGDHARPRARLARAGRPRPGAVLEGRGRRPPVRARRGDRPGRPGAGRRSTTSVPASGW